jgi:hypothetical protein
MSKLWQVVLRAGLFVVFAALVPLGVGAQNKAKDPEWKHGMKLRVREAGVRQFDPMTAEYGVEVFADDNSNHLLYIDEKANLALAKSDGKENGAKPPIWQHAMDFKVRKAGEADFTKTTKRYGVEVFRDDNTTSNLIYISDKASIAVVAGSTTPTGADAKEPVWTHGFELQVRKAGEKDFNKDTKKYGVEVFRDDNNGSLVYVSETGSIAVVAGVKTEGKTAPDWRYGFEVSARMAGEGEFSDKTKRYGVEVFQDVNNNNVIYISETGSIAVLPGVKVAATEKVKEPKWKYASDLAVRKASEAAFSKDTKKFGVEFYLDPNDEVMVAISQEGNLAIMPGK